MQGRRLSIDRKPVVTDYGGDGSARFRNWLKEQSKLVEARQNSDGKEKHESQDNLERGIRSRRGSICDQKSNSLNQNGSRRGSVFQGIENASNRAESRMSVTGTAMIGSRRGSIASTHPEDVDLGWLAWKESRRNESRRASVVSISGEDHGVKSVSKWTKAVNAVTDQAARENGREHKRSLKEKIHIRTGRSLSTTTAPSDNLRLRMLEDHLKKHSLRLSSHAMCMVCTRILEGQ